MKIHSLGRDRWRDTERCRKTGGETCDRAKLWIAAGVLAAVIASHHNAFAGTVNVKGSEAGSFVTANFSYDGISPALLAIYAGRDNVGGPFNGQEISEYSFTTGSCTAPDGSAGFPFVLVQADEVDTYHQGQLVSTAKGQADGKGCAGNTGITGAVLTLSVSYGTGKLANASGSITETFTCPTLAFNATSGIFGACQVTRTGSVTD